MSTLKKAYLLFTILAVLSLTIGANMENAAMSLFLPCLLMIGYTGYGHYMEAHRHYPHVFGDSLYYMGFTLTLAALGASLIQIGTAKEVSQETLRTMFATVGAGVATTILGMVLRTFTSHFLTDAEAELTITRANTEEIQRRSAESLQKLEIALNHLAEMARAHAIEVESRIGSLSGNIVNVHEYVDRIYRDVQQQAIEQIPRLVAAIEQSTQEFCNHYSALAVTALESMQRQAQGILTQQLDRAFAEQQTYMKVLQARLGEIFEETQERMHSDETLLSIARNRLQQVFREAIEQAQNIRISFEERIQQLQRRSQEVEELAKELDSHLQAERNRLQLQAEASDRSTNDQITPIYIVLVLIAGIVSFFICSYIIGRIIGG